MIQKRYLVRARGLASFRRALVERALEDGALAARRRAVIVPTRASAELLRQSIERAAAERGARAVVLPDLVTRDEWLGRAHAALAGATRFLTRAERDVLMARAAESTAARPRMDGAPFELRPGLTTAMLEFHDELKRRHRSVRRFARAMFDQLRVERGTDRGSESQIRQTCFLGLAFLAYERAVAASGALDEHALRDRLIAEQPDLPWDHLVVAAADHPSDPRGLWPADFDLAGRLTRLLRIDIVVTDELHDAGVRDRIERELPGIDEVRAPDVAGAPVLVAPREGGLHDRVEISRDREEELAGAARVVRAQAEQSGHVITEPTAVVFHRPLPYLYLAHQVMSDARLPYQVFDALPLGAEPYAALMDLVLAAARTGGTRETAVALLRSTLVRFDVDGERVGLRDASALEAVLLERRATGEADDYLAEVDEYFGERPTRQRLDAARARRAARAAAAIREALGPFRSATRASEQLGAIAAFLRAHERPVAPGDAWAERHTRARAAVLGVLDGLADAYRRHDDRRRSHEVLTAAVHHAIEAQTFAPRRGRDGVHLVDAVAARFGEFAHVHLIGLVEGDWPVHPRRSIFYTTGLLKALGWPQDPDYAAAQQAAFRDLVGLASKTTRLHAFQLDGDALVGLSPMVELTRGLPFTADATASDAPASIESLLAADEIDAAALGPSAGAWLTLRRRRPAIDTRAYRGTVDPQAPRPYKVSQVDRYVDCPFKYFSEAVLGLPEEREDASGLTPLERGTLLHELFERFYAEWQRTGHGAITPATLPEAMASFAALVRARLARLPDGDRALEETRLIGSIVARGVAERVFELEADAGGDIATRLLERELVGVFTFPELSGLKQREIAIRGKADRIDVLADGSLRVVDYKLGRMPDLEHSTQISVYAHCAKQTLDRADGRDHAIASAAYLAFGDDRELEGRLGTRSEPAAMAVQKGIGEFIKAVNGIEAGEFPPRPLRTGDCSWCRFAGVCRKEYLAEDHEAADAV